MTSRNKKAQTYPFALAPLPYPYEALEPHIDAKTMRIHHDKHHKTYVTKLNDALKDYPELHKLTIEELLLRLADIPAAIRTEVTNNGGGHFNHDFFWSVLRPAAAGADDNKPAGALAKAISDSFGSFDAFKDEFVKTGEKHFASGWVFLALNADDGKLEVFSRPNHATALQDNKHAILINDLWEHAYYLKHQNERPAYLKTFWNVVDWGHAAERYENARAQHSAYSKNAA